MDRKRRHQLGRREGVLPNRICRTAEMYRDHQVQQSLQDAVSGGLYTRIVLLDFPPKFFSGLAPFVPGPSPPSNPDLPSVTYPPFPKPMLVSARQIDKTMGKRKHTVVKQSSIHSHLPTLHRAMTHTHSRPKPFEEHEQSSPIRGQKARE